MNIIKKSGRIEEFQISKVRQSILNASEEVREPLSDAELKLIEKEVDNILSKLNRTETSSYEVFAICLNVLKELGFKAVCKSYLEGSISF
ncbi:ATP cone domain-containing protein [uncultured Clostridium sp.]|uniref:ATP cone domain-containing protein n=1 Tax=uncultured Clostridium sp. TaxID=59620 RepID=UPI0028EFD939|nr:ATP cone domain-containing protein [uncultured Clostridium sp.]